MKHNVLRSFSGKALLIATMLGGVSLAASAAAPQIKDYSVKPGNILFAAQCDNLTVYYDRDQVISATYELRQNGKVVFSGKDTGKSTGLDHSIFALNTTQENNTREVCRAMAVDKTLVPGEVEFAVTSVTYLEGDEEVTATNLGSVTWNLTDMPRVTSANPQWRPDKDLITLKLGGQINFTFDGTNFSSYKDENGTAVYVKQQIKNGKISLVQNDEVKAVFDLTTTFQSYFNCYPASLPTAKISDAQATQLNPGEFEIRLTEITYISPCTGEDVTVTDPEGLPTTLTSNSLVLIPERAKTFAYYVTTTKVESETITPLESELLSYYAEDDRNGVFSYTFNQPLAAGTSGNGDFVVKFRIGDANHEFDNVVPHTLSADKKTITVDLRGLSNGIPTLANNYNFVDDDGASYIPQYCTIFIENGLFDAFGTKVSVFCQFDPNQPGRYLDGQLWRTYLYKEISFATPALSDVLFYDSADPETKSETMAKGSNMMDVTVSNSEVIASAEPVYLVGETVVPATATRNGDIWSVELPESVVANGAEDLQFTLQNVAYTKVDGNEHIVTPVDLSGFAPVKEYATLADVVAYAAGTEVVLNAEGLLVTMSNEAITTVEDKTAAVFVIDYATGEPVAFTEGALLTGKICGIYGGGNAFYIDLTKSEYTVTEADATVGFDVTSMDDCNRLAFRLLTFSVDEGFELTPYEDDESIIALVNGTIPVMDATGVLTDYVCPEKIQSVTGVYYVMEETAMLLIRNADDIVAAKEPAIESISDLKASEIGKTVAISLTDAVITAVFEDTGMVFLQDDGCAVNLADIEGGDITFKRGASITGTLVGMYVGNHTFVVDFNESDFTESVVDVTYGHEISIEEVFDVNNQFRLVTFKNSDATPIQMGDYDMLQVGDNIYLNDMLGVLEDDSFENKRIDSLTGVLYFPDAQIFAGDADAPTVAFLIPRDANDIATTIVTGVEGILGNFDEAAPVYNLNGVKVREAGEGLKGLAKGIYVVNGVKVMVL